MCVRRGWSCSPRTEDSCRRSYRRPQSASDQDVPSPENLLQEYNDLRERFQRTTNALGSAAHDLKTPLSILNGYVELLQSEKLGPLSDRQREVLHDMQASGKRLRAIHSGFSDLQRARNRRAAHAVRAGQHQRVPVGSLPPLVESLSGKRVWRCIFWPTTSCRRFPSTLPSWSASSPICWKTLSSSRRRVEPCGCMPSRTCGIAAPPQCRRPLSAAAKT